MAALSLNVEDLRSTIWPGGRRVKDEVATGGVARPPAPLLAGKVIS